MKKIITLLIFSLSIFLVSCDNAGFEVISASTGKTMMDNDSSIILVDVREQSGYNEGHIEGAILLPLGLIEAYAESILIDKDATYILYCRSGNRSNQAAEIFVNLGYKNVYDMGGIIDWPYEIVI